MPNSNSSDYPPSYYAATANEYPLLPKLQDSIRTDICIVGGGYTGLSTALHLVEKGYKVVLLEANRIGWGASGRNGGQLHSGQRRDQIWLEKKYGVELAKDLWLLAEEAKATVLELIKRYNIRCDWESGLVHAMHKLRFVPDDHQFVDHMNSTYGYSALTKLTRSELAEIIGTDVYFGGSRDASAGHLHPLNLAIGIANAVLQWGNDAQIFEHSKVKRIQTENHPKIETEHGLVQADAVVLAGNGYLSQLDRETDRHVLPINNFIVATEPLDGETVRSLIPGREAVCDSRFVVNYWRIAANNRLLFGGGETYSHQFPRDIGKFVRPYLSKIYPRFKDIKFDYSWGGTLAVTPSRLPYFRRNGRSMYIASGFSGQGVALANFAGKCIAHAIVGDSEKFDMFANLSVPRFPGGNALRAPILALAMTWFALRDRL